jgi:hypothetical protein
MSALKGPVVGGSSGSELDHLSPVRIGALKEAIDHIIAAAERRIARGLAATVTAASNGTIPIHPCQNSHYTVGI